MRRDLRPLQVTSTPALMIPSLTIIAALSAAALVACGLARYILPAAAIIAGLYLAAILAASI